MSDAGGSVHLSGRPRRIVIVLAKLQGRKTRDPSKPDQPSRLILSGTGGVTQAGPNHVQAAWVANPGETGKPSPCTGPFILARMLRLQRFQNKYKAIDSSSTVKAIYKTISSYRYNQSSQASDNNSSHKPGDTTQRARTWSHNIQKGGLSPRGLRSDENKRSMQTCHTYLEK